MPMQELREYVATHTTRTACECGKCIDSGGNQQDIPAPWQVGAFRPHSADMVFFKVSLANNPDPDELRRLLAENKTGEWDDLDMLDNNEHSFIQVGAWIGDQGLAMQLMGLGWLLGLWQCMTPKMIGVDGDLAMQMAGAGYVSLIPRSEGSPIRYSPR